MINPEAPRLHISIEGMDFSGGDDCDSVGGRWRGAERRRGKCTNKADQIDLTDRLWLAALTERTPPDWVHLVNSCTSVENVLFNVKASPQARKMPTGKEMSWLSPKWSESLASLRRPRNEVTRALGPCGLSGA